MKRWVIVGIIVALFLTVAVGASADPIHVGGGPKSLSSPIHVGGGPKLLSSPIHVGGGPTIE
ncbi:MAG: hypothetical protein PHV11_02825 [Candidatus Bipolaricaulis sp.]|nr:hypothetical protein [Candidatus Bipolaricaulis sp.]MDD5219487.1 hypothetical protein [Candidatus Bipolaricaulis sp.]